MKPLLSVLIVTWNCRQLIGPCLDHLFASNMTEPFEVIVVDNQSRDGTAEVVRARPEAITVIEPGENLGFGRGNNLAAGLARGQYLLLLNPDAYLIDPDALPRLLAALQAGEREGCGAVAPRLNNPDGSHQIGDGGFAPTPANVLRHLSLISRMMASARGFYINHPALMQRERIMLDWLAATCLLVTRRAFETVGGFDPRFFMYGEDVDLGIRLGNAGYDLVLLPAVAVVHLQGATQRVDPDAIHVSTGWIDAIYALHQDGGWRPAVRRWTIAGAMVAGFGVRALAYGIRGRQGRKRASAMIRYASHGWAGRLTASRTRL
jgi:N-acetylglucosaminyl-diphospho-decaprenol L-rhamnosyltransferase